MASIDLNQYSYIGIKILDAWIQIHSNSIVAHPFFLITCENKARNLEDLFPTILLF